MLCKTAGISRNTFYEYYNNIYDCAYKLLQQSMEQIEIMYDKNIVYSKKEFLFIFFQCVKDHQDEFKILTALPLTKEISHIIMSIVMKYCHLNDTDTKWQLWCAYQFMGVYGLLQEWINNECKEEITEIMEFID